MKKNRKKKWDQKRQQLHELIVDQIHDVKNISSRTPIAPSKPPKARRQHGNTKIFRMKKPSPLQTQSEPLFGVVTRKTAGLPPSALNEIERLYQERLAKRRLREESKG